MTAPKQDAKNVMKRRDKAFWSGRESVKRVWQHLERLDRPSTSLSDRMMLWRLIADAALQAHEQEVQQLDSLNFAVADPSILPGGVVG